MTQPTSDPRAKTLPPTIRLYASNFLRLFLDHKFRRFLAVGVLNTVFGYGVFYVALGLTWQPLLALSFSTVAGVAFNFYSIGSIVFRQSDRRSIWRFVIAYALVFIVNARALRALEGAAPAAILQAMLLPGLALLAYILNRDFVFFDKKQSQGAP
jgi:putative flippase GtrA